MIKYVPKPNLELALRVVPFQDQLFPANATEPRKKSVRIISDVAKDRRKLAIGKTSGSLIIRSVRQRHTRKCIRNGIRLCQKECGLRERE